MRLVVWARAMQTASAAVFAVAFRCVVVVFRFIRAHKSKIAIYKGQLYCPFFKIHDLELCARKDSFGAKIRNKITQIISRPSTIPSRNGREELTLWSSPMNFASDNHYGVHPRILEAMVEANAGSAPAYGGDDWTKKAEEQLSKIFEKEVRSFLVTTGTAANGLAVPHACCCKADQTV
jgi:hypothetical protein